MPLDVASAAAASLHDTPAHYALGDDDGSSVDIATTWRVSKQRAHSAQQTDPLASCDQSTQSAATACSAAQTDSGDQSGLWGSEGGQLSSACVEWLATVLDAMERQVLANVSSHAFDGYSVSWDEDRGAVTKLHTLQHKPATATAAAGFPPSCTAVAWNSTGSLLAVAYSHLQHSGWCSHTSSLALWNIHRRQLRAEQADSVVELTSCISALCFHPTMPSVLVVGLHSGQIRVLDVSGGDDELICSSAIGALQHCEPITTLAFVPAMYQTTAAPSSDADGATASASTAASLASHLLVSSALDGKLLTWSLDNRLAYPVQGSLCSPSMHYHGHGSSNAFASLALSAVSFSADNRTYTAGTQAGGLLRGLHSQHARKSGTIKSGELRWDKDAYAYLEAASVVNKFEAKKQVEQHVQLQSKTSITTADIFASPLQPSLLYPPLATAAYQPHDGAVHALHFSPHHRALYLSASADGSVRLYVVGLERSVWSGVVGAGAGGGGAGWDVCWSASRPLVFGVADGDGAVYVYDLMVDVLRPVLTVRTDEQESGGRHGAAGVVKLRWNTHDGSVLAGVDVRGRVHVWQLGGKLSSVQPGEQRRLEEIAAAQ